MMNSSQRGFNTQGGMKTSTEGSRSYTLEDASHYNRCLWELMPAFTPTAAGSFQNLTWDEATDVGMGQNIDRRAYAG